MIQQQADLDHAVITSLETAAHSTLCLDLTVLEFKRAGTLQTHHVLVSFLLSRFLELSQWPLHHRHHSSPSTGQGPQENTYTQVFSAVYSKESLLADIKCAIVVRISVKIVTMSL